MAGSYGIIDSPIGMPAVRPRKAKPVAMCRAARLRLVLPTRYQTIATSTPTTSTCQTMLRNFGSDQDSLMPRFGATRVGCRRGSSVAPDIMGKSLGV